MSNLTYIKTGEGRHYLTAILALADRQVVGLNLIDSMNRLDTSVGAWRMAINKMPVKQNILFHSDRGV